ncbi:DNA N-6-adenine-methyltransferase [Acetobacter pasteurianus]|uniref:Adenine methyltransferase n=1 Tax=Acetobacter pasteurianus NBRC 3188 TaxID=1226663 RepID=A0A401WY06_ACEPA|nr:DNA N-6-adenine-methyltransferase [Acetobacter pasteurianus]GCD54201.1 hypothetical protein NBRC3188_2898 [Acetobacter pasteurianus NBRC 3188]
MASQKTFLAAPKTSNLSASPDLNPKKSPRKRGMSSHHSSAPGTTTWLTPRDILEPLGKFDLDPCSAPDPNLWPTAETHYTAPKQDGLLLPWFGRIWLNPPYTNSGLMKWMSKMAHHNHGLALLFARVETEVYFKTIWSAASAILFLKGRPHFHHGDGTVSKENCGAPLALISYGESDAELLLDGVLPGAAIPLNRVTMLYAISGSSNDTENDQSFIPTWREVIIDAVQSMKKKSFSMADLYGFVADHPKAKSNPNWKAKIRQTVARVGFKKEQFDLYQAAF